MPNPAPQDTPVDDFDLETWINEAKLPERSATVYARADLVAELEDLETELDKATSLPADDRMGSKSTAAGLEERIRVMRSQLRSSALTFRFRSLPRARQLEIQKAATVNDAVDTDLNAAGWVSAASVHPRIATPEQAQSLRDRIGEAQFVRLWDAAYAASNGPVAVPFSLIDSEVPISKDS